MGALRAFGDDQLVPHGADVLANVHAPDRWDRGASGHSKRRRLLERRPSCGEPTIEAADDDIGQAEHHVD